MANQEISEYIRRGVSKGISLTHIKDELIRVGWPEPDVNEAISMFKEEERKLAKQKSGALIKTISKRAPFLVILVVAGSVFTFLMMGGWVLFASGNADCDTNFYCFTLASQFCKTAKVTHNTTTEVLGIVTIGAVSYQVNSTEEEKCVLSFNAEGTQEVHFSDELLQSMQEQGKSMEQITQEEKGLGGEVRLWTCVFNNTDELVSLLNKVQSSGLSIGVACDTEKCNYGGDLASAYCSA